jgi:hypothetical protein
VAKERHGGHEADASLKEGNQGAVGIVRVNPRSCPRVTRMVAARVVPSDSARPITPSFSIFSKITALKSPAPAQASSYSR